MRASPPAAPRHARVPRRCQHLHRTLARAARAHALLVGLEVHVLAPRVLFHELQLPLPLLTLVPVPGQLPCAGVLQYWDVWRAPHTYRDRADNQHQEREMYLAEQMNRVTARVPPMVPESPHRANQDVSLLPDFEPVLVPVLLAEER